VGGKREIVLAGRGCEGDFQGGEEDSASQGKSGAREVISKSSFSRKKSGKRKEPTFSEENS